MVLSFLEMGNQDAHQSFKHDCKSSALFAPCFVWNGNNIVTVKNGEPATLPCKVKNVDTTKTVVSVIKSINDFIKYFFLLCFFVKLFSVMDFF